MDPGLRYAGPHAVPDRDHAELMSIKNDASATATATASRDCPPDRWSVMLLQLVTASLPSPLGHCSDRRAAVRMPLLRQAGLPRLPSGEFGWVEQWGLGLAASETE
jgi:hypothetical protein